MRKIRNINDRIDKFIVEHCMPVSDPQNTMTSKKMAKAFDMPENIVMRIHHLDFDVISLRLAYYAVKEMRP